MQFDEQDSKGENAEVGVKDVEFGHGQVGGGAAEILEIGGDVWSQIVGFVD